jgi:hypothetical protein
MTDQQNSIIPPLELVEKWASEWMCIKNVNRDNFMATRAAQWGADQELEACVELTRDNDGYDAALGLRATRRPKPLSLKERALQAWVCVEAGTDDQTAMAVIRRALEALDG